jgi:hypothetical protein
MIDKERQSIVLVVNIDSPKINQVNIGNTINPVQEPINLADHTESIDSDTSFQAYQNEILVGIPNTKAATTGLFCHHEENFCRLR